MSDISDSTLAQCAAHCLPGDWQQQQGQALASTGAEANGLPVVLVQELQQAHLGLRDQSQALLRQMQQGWWSLRFDDGPGNAALSLSAIAPWQLEVRAGALQLRALIHPQPLRLLALQGLDHRTV